VHGFERGGELQDAIDQKSATVVERDGRITGYATAIDFFAHGVARGNQDLIALIAAAPEFTGPRFLPADTQLRGLRVVSCQWSEADRADDPDDHWLV
jgi:hypothetical protein